MSLRGGGGGGEWLSECIWQLLIDGSATCGWHPEGSLWSNAELNQDKQAGAISVGGQHLINLINAVGLSRKAGRKAAKLHAQRLSCWKLSALPLPFCGSGRTRFLEAGMPGIDTVPLGTLWERG